MQHYNPHNVIVEMSKLECSLCGESSWLFVSNNEEIKKLRCHYCNAWIAQMDNSQQNEENIIRFQGEQI